MPKHSVVSAGAEMEIISTLIVETEVEEVRDTIIQIRERDNTIITTQDKLPRTHHQQRCLGYDQYEIVFLNV